ncbi:CubicO group peptidase, beta-lactamase class C family [Actinacidiphila yanglinensis]|uniref:CubicO group peptidase, beta-lactamase class C family n=1 Tax=Actinacidiphila yanglinensis TaxID=310779 RepID=A0A1H6A983_9ACTN|nr:serine hydrolase domain-containing protein [Actinacidiphila yanglinensis]SEG44764.1 CubicO group peptidase, beta-lactamase class C family [Actinacidiphila yanglinensis]
MTKSAHVPSAANLGEVLRPYVEDDTLPGAVALVCRGGDVQFAAVGSTDAEGRTPMARDSIFRIASITKPITAAAVMVLIDDGRLDLADPVARWLPELAAPSVVRSPAAAVDDVVPAVRAITVEDLLSSLTGYGFPSDFTLPAVQPLLAEGVQRDGREPQRFLPTDEWIETLAGIPLLYQPGEAWLYNTSSDLQGLLIERVSGQSLPDFLAERVFERLGMPDTGFTVPAAKRDRLTSYYRADDSGGLELVDGPDGQWSTMPPFASGAGGLVSTVDDWLAFGRMLLAEGATADGRRLLSTRSVRLMTTDRLTPAQREASPLFLEGQSWGYGGSVDVEAVEPWNVPGRYGWVGGTGTSAHVVPSTGSVHLLFTQVGVASPVPTPQVQDFWRYAAGV